MGRRYPAGAAGRGRAAPTAAAPERGEGGLRAKPARVSRADGEKPLERFCDPVKRSERINMSKPPGGPGTFLATPSRLKPSRPGGLRGAGSASAAAPRSVRRGRAAGSAPCPPIPPSRTRRLRRQSPAHPPAAAVLRGRFSSVALLPADKPREPCRACGSGRAA